MVKYIFKITEPNLPIRVEALQKAVIRVGKVASADLKIPSSSRMHAVIETTDQGPRLIDLGSAAGTFVNGQKVSSARLRSGDTLHIGDAWIELRIED